MVLIEVDIYSKKYLKSITSDGTEFFNETTELIGLSNWKCGIGEGFLLHFLYKLLGIFLPLPNKLQRALKL